MEEFSLEKVDQERLLKTAREAIGAELEHRRASFPPSTDTIEKECGAFVTLHKHGALRGCIGNMQGTGSLLATVREMAVSAAFHDPRFPPLKQEEFEEIDIEITVLTPMEPCEDSNKIEIGTHGLYIRSGRRSGVLLPQVPVEQDWDRETFLGHTCMKAGLPGDCWKDTNTELYTFRGIIFGEKS